MNSSSLATTYDAISFVSPDDVFTYGYPSSAAFEFNNAMGFDETVQHKILYVIILTAGANNLNQHGGTSVSDECLFNYTINDALPPGEQ
jgi:hypothetical protein